MKTIFCPLSSKHLLAGLTKFLTACFVLVTFTQAVRAQNVALTPTADAYVRNGSFSNINYGSDTGLFIKSSRNSGFTRLSYLKFSLSSVAVVRSAKLRLYGSNKVDAATINIALSGVSDDSWTESGINFNNAPTSASYITSTGVNSLAGYYEFDVTDFVNTQLGGDKLVSFLLRDTSFNDKHIIFNSKEYGQNLPELLVDVTPQDQFMGTFTPMADAYVRNGTFSDSNFGSDTSLIVKSSKTPGFTRASYLKFSLTAVDTVKSAKLRLYGANKDNTAAISLALFGVTNDSWTEAGITFNNAPPDATFISTTGVNNIAGYYEFDVTNFVNAQLSADKVISFALKDTSFKDKSLVFNSKEYGLNLPQLVIDTTPVPKPISLLPSADAYVRNGSFANTNFGSDTSLIVKTSPTSGLSRNSYLKFSLGSLTYIRSAKVRLYLSGKDNAALLFLPMFGINNDSWTETGITFNNAPAPTASSLIATAVNNQPGYYEFEVTNFVKQQLNGDKVVSFLIKDTLNKNTNITFNSKENDKNRPQLLIDTATSNALLFVENMDGYPSNDHVVFSTIEIPWTRDTVYNANHDSVKVRLHNYGINPLVISNLKISVDSLWKINKFNGLTYNPVTQLPATIAPGGAVDLMVKFTARKVGNKTTRVKILHQTLTITSNDDKAPDKKVYLDGLWQYSGEGLHEPYSQEVITTFGYKTSTGFGFKDPDLGDTTKLKGDEIKPDFFLRADTTLPVTIRQLAAYHGCCHQQEYFKWFSKSSTSTYNTVFLHVALDGQTLLPRRSLSGSPALGTMTPSGPFGVIIGPGNTTSPYLNNPKQFGVRVYKAIDEGGNIIPNAYILASDYLGSESNHDYNDNMYYVTNIKPYQGTVYNSPLNAIPSDLDFGEHILQTKDSLLLTLSSGGNNYSNGTSDPQIVISSVVITGENKDEFSADMPLIKTLNPQQKTTIKVTFNPKSQGLKIADMLVYYSNSKSPKRIPLYGIAKAPGVSVAANYRINSGSAVSTIFEGKTWAADTQYVFDNLEPYKNPVLKQIEATEEDFLYLDEQSSNGEKKPFRYQFPVENGKYYVRLHFAEIYWGAPGAGLTGGAGSRVFNVKIENQYRLLNYDLTGDVGAATAVIRNFPVTITDGQLNIDFSATLNRPLVSAVEVYSFSTPAVAAQPISAVQNRSAQISLTQPVLAGEILHKPRVYPNPLLNKNLNIEFPVKYKGTYAMQLVDMVGRKYSLGKTNLNGSALNKQVDISGLGLKPGVYFLKISSTANKTDVLKLLIR